MYIAISFVHTSIYQHQLIINYVGNLVVYGNFAAGLIPIPLLWQYQILGPNCVSLQFVNVSNYKLLRLGSGQVMLDKCAVMGM